MELKRSKLFIKLFCQRSRKRVKLDICALSLFSSKPQNGQPERHLSAALMQPTPGNRSHGCRIPAPDSLELARWSTRSQVGIVEGTRRTKRPTICLSASMHQKFRIMLRKPGMSAEAKTWLKLRKSVISIFFVTFRSKAFISHDMKFESL